MRALFTGSILISVLPHSYVNALFVSCPLPIGHKYSIYAFFVLFLNTHADWEIIESFKVEGGLHIHELVNLICS